MSGSERVNTTLSGSGRVDDIKGHPQGEVRGLTKLVKTDLRRELARQPFEQKIRKVARLIQLATKMKAERTTATAPQFPQKRSVDSVR